MRLRDGGVVRAVLELSQALAARGHSVTLLTADDSGVPDQWKHAPTPTTPRCIPLTLRDRLAELRRSTAAAERDTVSQLLDRPSMDLVRAAIRAADVVHVHGPWASSNLQVAAAARRAKVPYIASPHGMLDDWCMAQGALKKRLHLALLSRRMLEKARWVHCTAQGELDQARKHFRRAAAVVIPLPFEAPAFKAPAGSDADCARLPALANDLPKVLFLGRLNAIKGVEKLIEAARLLKERGRPVHTLIAGPAQPAAYGDELQALAVAAGLGGSCEFLGLVGGDAKVSLYTAADVFVLPSEHENFGFVLLEALACGTPVVTTRGVSIWRELEQGGGALIVDGNPEAIAQAIELLLRDPARSADMGRRGRAWVTAFTDQERTLTAYEAMYTAC